MLTKFMSAVTRRSHTPSFQHPCPSRGTRLPRTSAAAHHAGSASAGQHGALLRKAHVLMVPENSERKTAPLQIKTPHEQKTNKNIREPLIQVCGSFTEPHSLIQT